MPESHAEPNLDQLLKNGRRAHRSGRLDQAAACYRSILDVAPECVEALYLLGLVAYRRGHVDEAMKLVSQALQVDPTHAMAHGSMGQMHQDLGDHRRAIFHFRAAGESRPDDASLLNALGVSLAHLDDLHGAMEAYRRAIRSDPARAQTFNNLGNLQYRMGDMAGARRSYERCLELRPDFAEAHNNLGVLYHESRRIAEAVEHFEAALSIRGDYAEAGGNLGAVYSDIGEYDKALDLFRAALTLNPGFVEARINSGVALQGLGRHRQARAELDHALASAPGDPAARWSRCVAELESVYDSTEAVDTARAGYERRLRELVSTIDLKNSQVRARAASSVGTMQPFLLPYQARDDRALQSVYGDFVCAAMAQPSPPAPATRDSGRIRVGIVSGHFYDHSNWKLPIRGWLQHLAPEFELFGYYTGFKQDAQTRRARALCSRFRSGMPVDQFATAIIDDRIDVLIYPEIGMNPASLRLAARRLAPVQCASWGHPVTTGLPTMDYFLGSDLMEPEDAQAHYRERLVRLPGLSVVCERPEPMIRPEADRRRFGLADTDVVFLCVQNLSKYLPCHDNLLAAIVARVPRARLVFIRGGDESSERLAARLGRAFDAAGLDFARHSRFLPRLDQEAWVALNDCADVFLDTPEWSGCNSTLEAIARDLPVVTLPGRYMRGRHSHAFLRRMGIDDLIARDEAHYVELAATLGNDAPWRELQRRRIAECKAVLYDDTRPVQGLGDFIRRKARACL